MLLILFQAMLGWFQLAETFHCEAHPTLLKSVKNGYWELGYPNFSSNFFF